MKITQLKTGLVSWAIALFFAAGMYAPLLAQSLPVVIRNGVYMYHPDLPMESIEFGTGGGTSACVPGHICIGTYLSKGVYVQGATAGAANISFMVLNSNGSAMLKVGDNGYISTANNVILDDGSGKLSAQSIQVAICSYLIGGSDVNTAMSGQTGCFHGINLTNVPKNAGDDWMVQQVRGGISGTEYLQTAYDMDTGDGVGYVRANTGAWGAWRQIVPTPIAATVTTTAATSDAFVVTGMTASGHCSLAPDNASAATNLTTTYISARASGSLTLTHTATAGMIYDVTCTPN